MNIFDLYLDKIKILLKDLSNKGTIKLPEDLSSINVDIPPLNFNCDISTNVSMVLSKINNKSPLDLANILVKFIKKLFNKIKKNPVKYISKEQLSIDKYRAISDFISGMTDRYAINLHNNIK